MTDCWALARLCRLSGVLFVANREAGFGLAAQEPWIQHATVRDNILFGKDYDAVFYQAVIEACALSDDLSVGNPSFSNRDVNIVKVYSK